MLLTPTSGDSKIISNSGIVGTANPGTSVPDGASNTYGAVTELISAANNVSDSWGIAIMCTRTEAITAVAGEQAVDILIGGATDDVLISSLLFGGAFYGGVRTYFFPIHIPAGVRIAARLASFDAQGTESRVVVHLFSGMTPPFQIGRKVTTYGTKINDARGLAVSPSNSGAAASVTEMTASTTEDHMYFMPGFQVSVDSTIVGASFTNIGIGVGAATEERVGTWWFTKNASEEQSGPFPSMGIWRDVPAGTRLTLLASRADAAGDTDHDGHIYAVS